MTNSGRSYGCLAVTRRRGGLFRKPDGATERFEEHAAAVDARAAWLSTEILPEATAAARKAREEFVRGCTVKGRSGKQAGIFQVFRDIYGPAGELLETLKLGLAFSEDVVTRRIEALATDRFPEPTLANLQGISDSKVVETVVWTAGVYLDGEYTRLPAFDSWTFGFPIEGVIGVLNTLSRDGWSVAQVSEDRGLITGANGHPDSAVTTARYLLVRG
jgi:hypothetical protein